MQLVVLVVQESDDRPRLTEVPPGTSKDVTLPLLLVGR